MKIIMLQLNQTFYISVLCKCVSDLFPPFSALCSTGGLACVPPDHCRPSGFRSGEGAAQRGRLQPQDPQQSQEDPA